MFTETKIFQGLIYLQLIMYLHQTLNTNSLKLYKNNHQNIYE